MNASWRFRLVRILTVSAALFVCNCESGSGGADSTGVSGKDIVVDGKLEITGTDRAAEETGEDCGYDCPPVVKAAIVGEELVSVPFFGDLWANTWADDDRLYMSWGDGTGLPACAPTYDFQTPGAWADWPNAQQVVLGCFDVSNPCPEDKPCVMQELFCGVFECFGECFPLCPWTDAGLLAMSGTVPEFDDCQGPDGCIIQRHLPVPSVAPVDELGNHIKDDKTSSLLFIDGRLYMAGHVKAGNPELGYIAYSDDHGKNWTQVDGSPWGPGSHFRDMVFINMGKAHELALDDYIYALGTGEELSPEASMQVRLTRVHRTEITKYEKYEYLSGLDSNQQPVWSPSQDDAAPLDGLETHVQGSALFHPGIGRFLYLTGVVSFASKEGGLYEAPTPWGRWTKVAAVPGASISSLIAKGNVESHVYYTAAGGTSTYNLHLGRIDMVVE